MALMTLTSPAFRYGDVLPHEFTLNGDNVSPPIRWRNIPGGGPILVVVAISEDQNRDPIVHWLRYNILSFVDDKLEADEDVDWAEKGLNDGGSTDYWGPDKSELRTVDFRLYALNRTIDVDNPLDWASTEQEMEDKLVRGPSILRAHYPGLPQEVLKYA